jgi:hypothetical protein
MMQLQLRGRNGNAKTVYVLTARVKDDAICYGLHSQGSTIPLSLSNLQAKLDFPTLAWPEWQDEVIAAANSSLFPVESVRR